MKFIIIGFGYWVRILLNFQSDSHRVLLLLMENKNLEYPVYSSDELIKDNIEFDAAIVILQQ